MIEVKLIEKGKKVVIERDKQIIFKCPATRQDQSGGVGAWEDGIKTALDIAKFLVEDGQAGKWLPIA